MLLINSTRVAEMGAGVLVCLLETSVVALFFVVRSDLTRGLPVNWKNL